MEIHNHYRGRPIRMAKCGKYSYSRCMRNCKEADECKTCTLVKRQSTNIYKWVGIVKYKKCPKCGEYYPIKTGYYKNGSRTTPPAWCKYCHSKLQRELKQLKQI